MFDAGETYTLPVKAVGSNRTYTDHVIEALVIPDSVVKISGLLGDGLYIYGGGQSNDTLKNIILPYGVTEIAARTFHECTALTKIVIPNSVISIGENAFWGCSNLANITIGNSAISSVKTMTFYNCGFENVYFTGTLADWCNNRGYVSDLTSTENLYIDGKLIEGELVIPHGVTRVNNSAFKKRALTKVSLPETVTEIGYFAFNMCTSLSNINIPQSVSAIGERAFENCVSLTEINITGPVTLESRVFWSCDNLTTANIEGATSIGSECFWECGNLTNVVIGNNLKTIDGYAFNSCSNLTNVYFNGDLSNWCQINYVQSCNPMSYAENLYVNGEALSGEVVIPDGTKYINEYAFKNCKSITSITIPDTVTSVGRSAFSGCTGLVDVYYTGDIAGWCAVNFESSFSNPMYYADNLYINRKLVEGEFVIPDGVTSIDNYMFHGCTGLTNITIPDSVTAIGDDAFSGCTGLTSVTIPDSVTTIGSSAFNGCTSLTSVTIGNSVTSIGSSVFNGCTGLTNVTIPDGVKSVGSRVFSGCTELTSITIPDSVTSIGTYAFDGCTKLKSIAIPNGVTKIDNYTFRRCINLTNIRIPDSVTSIGDYAFYHCNKLTDIFYTGTSDEWSAITIGSYNYTQFYNPIIESATIHYES